MTTNTSEEKDNTVPDPDLEPLEDFHLLVDFFQLLIKVDRRNKGKKY